LFIFNAFVSEYALEVPIPTLPPVAVKKPFVVFVLPVPVKKPFPKVPPVLPIVLLLKVLENPGDLKNF
jgi:hypothetical protein